MSDHEHTEPDDDERESADEEQEQDRPPHVPDEQPPRTDPIPGHLPLN